MERKAPGTSLVRGHSVEHMIVMVVGMGSIGGEANYIGKNYDDEEDDLLGIKPSGMKTEVSQNCCPERCETADEETAKR